MSGLRASVASKASAGGQDEQPWLVKSSSTQVTATGGVEAAPRPQQESRISDARSTIGETAPLKGPNVARLKNSIFCAVVPAWPAVSVGVRSRQS